MSSPLSIASVIFILCNSGLPDSIVKTHTAINDLFALTNDRNLLMQNLKILYLYPLSVLQ